MFIFDTDYMSLLDRGGDEGERLLNRLRDVPLDDIATTIVSYEEQVRGWMSQISQTRLTIEQTTFYIRLKKQMQQYCRIAVIDFDQKSALEFDRLRKSKIRIGSMDLKIAAIALVNNATLLTRNFKDFQKVPGLKIEDWIL